MTPESPKLEAPGTALFCQHCGREWVVCEKAPCAARPAPTASPALPEGVEADLEMLASGVLEHGLACDMRIASEAASRILAHVQSQSSTIAAQALEIARLDKEGGQVARKELLEEGKRLLAAFDAQSSTIAGLQEALRPFAELIGGNYHYQPDDMLLDVGFGSADLRFKISLGAFRAARAALKPVARGE